MSRSRREIIDRSKESIPGVSGTLTPDAFNQMITDSSSFSLTIDSGSRNAIQWIAAKDRILIGTSGGEWRLSGHSSKPLTPTNYEIKAQTVWGSKDMQPLVLHEAILFVDFVGKKLREIIWNGTEERYLSPDLLLLAEHITKSGGITTMAYQRHPDSIIWATLANGELISCTYVREQDVVAWARHPLPGGGTYTEGIPAEGSIVYGDYLNFFVSGSRSTMGDSVIHFNLDGTYVTDWGDSGGWGDSDNQRAGAMHMLSDGRLLVCHYAYEDGDGNTVALAMLDEDGILDRTWGVNGHYPTIKVGDYDYESWTDPGYTNLFECNDGSFIAIGINYYHKITADGELDTVLQATGYPTPHSIVYGGAACWADDNKERLIVCSREYVVALDPETLTVDTSWGGLNANDGFSKVGYGVASAYCISIIAQSDGFIILHGQHADQAVITKLSLDGTAIDTTWGDSGYFKGDYYGRTAVGTLQQDEDGNIYYFDVADTDAGFTRYQYVVKISSDGTLIKELEFDNGEGGSGDYIDMNVINDRVYLFTEGSDTATYILEWYSTDLDFIGGFNPGNWTTGARNSFIPNSYTRESSNVGTYVNGVGYSESVCVIPGSDEDEVWITVARTINGNIVRYVERMKPRYWGTDQEDCFFVDSGLTYDGDPANNFTGLGHLEGETVAILGDGGVFPNQVVTGGTLPENLDQTVSVAHIGLAYTYKLKPMRSDQNIGGTTKGSIKVTAEAVVSFYKTLNARYGNGTDSHGIDFRTTEPYTTPPELHTGDKLVHPDAGYSVEDPFQIEGSDPLPCTVRCIIPRIEKTGR